MTLGSPVKKRRTHFEIIRIVLSHASTSGGHPVIAVSVRRGPNVAFQDRVERERGRSEGLVTADIDSSQKYHESHEFLPLLRASVIHSARPETYPATSCLPIVALLSREQEFALSSRPIASAPLVGCGGC
jgi:hypothetical protein